MTVIFLNKVFVIWPWLNVYCKHADKVHGPDNAFTPPAFDCSDDGEATLLMLYFLAIVADSPPRAA